MGLRDHFRREKHGEDEHESGDTARDEKGVSSAPNGTIPVPVQTAKYTPQSPVSPSVQNGEFTFMRTTTTTAEVLHVPDHIDSFGSSASTETAQSTEKVRKRRSFLGLAIRSKKEKEELKEKKAGFYENGEDSGDHSDGSVISRSSVKSGGLLHRHRRNTSQQSINLPDEIPTIEDTVQGDDKDEAWERRAALLARSNAGSRNVSPARGVKTVDKAGDADIQEAIRLHESGDLVRSTALFGRLADPNSSNNALAQVLYGLALRHGWGIKPDATKAIHYLSLAASSSASIETLALNSGIKRGGAAKGELVLAIFELANCFRYGWGIDKDAPAAFQYYLTAANLGDPDAMNETAWCLVEGFGTKKDKYKAATWLRKVEGLGNKQLGNSWIWKPKYDPKS